MSQVNPRMVTLAREAAGMTQTALAHAAGISQAQLSKIEHGLEEPTEEAQAAFARECEVPVSFFNQQDPVLGEGIIEFFHRKRMTLPAKALKRAHAQTNIMRLETLRLLRTIELTDVAAFPVYPVDEYGSPDEIARLTRATWRLPSGPLPDLIALIEATGVPVLQFSLGHEKLSAISVPGEAGRHLIVLNGDLPASHQRFALAHELGHLTMHSGVPSDDLEQEANQFASALLMPSDDIRPALRGVRFRDLGGLKPVWRVSLAALIRRAHDLDQISDRQYRTFNMQLNQLPGGRKREPGEFPSERPRLLAHIIEHYQQDLEYSMEDLQHLMVAHEDHIRRSYLGEEVRTLRPVGRRDGATIHQFPVRGLS